MSNAPDPRWSPSGHPSAGQPPSPAASLKWRLMHSWWLLLPALGMSCLGGFGFLYVGLRAKRPAWWIAGIVYLVVGWTAFILVGESRQGDPLTDWMTGVVLAVWFTSIAHAVMINSSWLRWRAGYRPWHAQPQVPGTLAPPPGANPTAPPVSGANPTAPPVSGVDPAGPGVSSAVGPGRPAPEFSTPGYYGTGPAAAPVPPGGGPRPLDMTAGQLDVNTARPEEFAALPGLDPQRVRQVLAERDRRGGFGSVSEFVAAAGLAPHEYARLRDNLVCSPPARPGPLQHPPSGRVLDV